MKFNNNLTLKQLILSIVIAVIMLNIAIALTGCGSKSGNLKSTLVDAPRTSKKINIDAGNATVRTKTTDGTILLVSMVDSSPYRAYDVIMVAQGRGSSMWTVLDDAAYKKDTVTTGLTYKRVVIQPAD